MADLINPAQLSALAAVADEGSFEAAARRLHVTPSAVSQRVKALEQQLGQVLLRRAKPCRPTRAGQELMRLSGQIELLQREALAAVRGPDGADPVPHRVPIVVNADSLASWFLTALTQVRRQHDVVFDLQVEDQDHSAELLRNGSVIAAVTAEPTAVQGCRVQALGGMRYLAVATPELVGRFSSGPSTGSGSDNDRATGSEKDRATRSGGGVDFGRMPMIIFNDKDGLQHRFLRKMSRRALEPPTHLIPSSTDFTEAVRMGLGWGMVPEAQAVPDLAEGRLVALAERNHLDVPLYWQHWALDSPLLRSLTTAVVEAASDSLR